MTSYYYLPDVERRCNESKQMSNLPITKLPHPSASSQCILNMLATVSLADATTMIALVVPLCLSIPSTTCFTLFSRHTSQVAQVHKRDRARCTHVHKRYRNDVHVVRSGPRVPRELRLARTYMLIRMLHIRCGMGLHANDEVTILAVKRLLVTQSKERASDTKQIVNRLSSRNVARMPTRHHSTPFRKCLPYGSRHI